MITLLLLQGVGDLPWAQMGVGGVLAGIMFYFYRLDRKSSEERYEKLSLNFRQIVEENTKAVTKLTETLDRENGSYGGA